MSKIKTEGALVEHRGVHHYIRVPYEQCYVDMSTESDPKRRLVPTTKTAIFRFILTLSNRAGEEYEEMYADRKGLVHRIRNLRVEKAEAIFQHYQNRDEMRVWTRREVQRFVKQHCPPCVVYRYPKKQ